MEKTTFYRWLAALKSNTGMKRNYNLAGEDKQPNNSRL